MRAGTCPKCNSSEVYKSYAGDNSVDAGLGTGNDQALLNIHADKDGKHGDDFTLLYLEYYVCRNCGYIEQYTHDLTDLAKLMDAKNWQRVERT